MNSNIYFLFVWLETILFSSTEITYFSSQLSFYLANIKSKIWQLYVIWRHHCQSTRGSYLPLLIFSYKGISILYYSMDLEQCLTSNLLKHPISVNVYDIPQKGISWWVTELYSGRHPSKGEGKSRGKQR